MSAPLRVRTVYDQSNLAELQRVAGRTFEKKKIRRRRVILLLVGLMGLGIGIPTLAQGQGAIQGTGCVLIGGGLTLWSLFFYSCTAWTAGLVMKKEAKVSEFELEKDALTVLVSDQRVSVPYTACQQLLEAEKCFYLLLEGGTALMLDKGNISGGTGEDVRAWLAEKCGKPVTWAGRPDHK